MIRFAFCEVGVTQVLAAVWGVWWWQIAAAAEASFFLIAEFPKYPVLREPMVFARLVRWLLVARCVPRVVKPLMRRMVCQRQRSGRARALVLREPPGRSCLPMRRL